MAGKGRRSSSSTGRPSYAREVTDRDGARPTGAAGAGRRLPRLVAGRAAWAPAAALARGRPAPSHPAAAARAALRAGLRAARPAPGIGRQPRRAETAPRRRAAAARAAPAPRAGAAQGRHAPGARRGRRAYLHRPPAGRGRGRPRPDHGPQARSADPLVGRAGLRGPEGARPTPGRHARGAGRRRVPPAPRRAAARARGAWACGRPRSTWRWRATGSARPGSTFCAAARRSAAGPGCWASCSCTLLLAVAGSVGLVGWQIYQRQHLLAEQTRLATGSSSVWPTCPNCARGSTRCGRRPASSPTIAAAGRRRSWCSRC